MAKITVNLGGGTYRKLLKVALQEHKSITQVVQKIIEDAARANKKVHVNKYARKKK